MKRTIQQSMARSLVNTSVFCHIECLCFVFISSVFLSSSSSSTQSFLLLLGLDAYICVCVFLSLVSFAPSFYHTRTVAVADILLAVVLVKYYFFSHHYRLHYVRQILIQHVMFALRCHLKHTHTRPNG